MDPTLFTPVPQGFGGIHLEKIQRIAAQWGQLGMLEPVSWKFPVAVSHILPPKDPQREHVPGGQFRFELGIEILTGRFGQVIGVARLHEVVTL